MTQETKGLAAAGLTAVSWSFLAIFIKMALPYATVETIAFFRFAVAFSLLVVISLIFFRKDYLSKILSLPKIIYFGGIALGLNYWGFTKGVSLANAVSAQIYIQTGPILLALFGILLFKERIRGQQIMGWMLTIVGFYLFYKDQFGMETSAHYNEGVLWITFAAVAWTVYSLITKTIPNKHSALIINQVVFLLGGLTLFSIGGSIIHE